MGVKQNKKNVDIQFHVSDFDSISPFIDDIEMDSNKKIESLEMQTQVEIHNKNSNSKHDLDTTISQPLDLVSSQSNRVGAMDAAADGDLTVIKLSKLQTHTSLDEKVKML